ncbi:hypothetical protein OCU04_003762 [Sclerotinia nivalis]|uniref:Reverse transcriptase Ty1/copia-type domain-containing protein n=1 Tax=Sclerotinia nivalis TaxID=352851 RepID=A0A9X0DNJ9_9HELO|nr:hypothetical protein OCU04_003762 [Sclerotinia nivalis]
MAWKLLFVLALRNDWLIHKIDMVLAFAQGNIDTPLILTPPEGFNELNNKALKLNKALYGLKQSARIWYYTLKDILNKLDFNNLITEECIFINKNKNIILSIYVDDIAIIAPNQEIINEFISNLKKHFDLKDLGPIKDYLGIQIERKADCLKLHQSEYTKKILARFGMQDSHPVSTPMDPKIKLYYNKEKANNKDIKLYQEIIGSLLYLSLGTRLDIAFHVGRLASFSSNPSSIHLQAAKRILRYLRGTINKGTNYKRNNNPYIKGYCDSDYGGDVNTYKSTSGYVFTLAEGPISWKSKLQSVVAQSTSEAEFIAINIAAKEAIYIKKLLKELNLYKQDKFPLYTDNQAALALAKNPIFHERSKHIAIRFYYIRDIINSGDLDLIYISTNDQKADGLTKPLARIKLIEFLKQINLY